MCKGEYEMSVVFSDKELQIAAQLGYFSFSDNMYGSLGDLFKEPIIHTTLKG